MTGPAAAPNRARWRRWRIPLAVFAFGVGLHLPHLGTLGLWNDDVIQFLQPLYAARGDVVRFLLTDTSPFVSGGERPLAYVPFVFARLA